LIQRIEMKNIAMCVGLAIFAMIPTAGTYYHGAFSLDGVEIQYEVPSVLIGQPEYTRANDRFHRIDDLVIFWSSYPEKRWWKLVPGTGGISISLSPYAGELKGKHDLAAYTAFYQRILAERGQTAKITQVKFSDETWFRIEEHFGTGILARVVYAAPMLIDYQIVCRIGRVDDFDPDVPNVKWPEWLPAFDELVKSIVLSKAVKP
jgi:hypothetical protein